MNLLPKSDELRGRSGSALCHLADQRIQRPFGTDLFRGLGSREGNRQSPLPAQLQLRGRNKDRPGGTYRCECRWLVLPHRACARKTGMSIHTSPWPSAPPDRGHLLWSRRQGFSRLLRLGDFGFRQGRRLLLCLLRLCRGSLLRPVGSFTRCQLFRCLRDQSSNGVAGRLQSFQLRVKLKKNPGYKHGNGYMVAAKTVQSRRRDRFGENRFRTAVL